MDEGPVELVFFDTFSHDASAADGPNLDLVQFNKPVVIRDVRIIPLGTKVQAEFPGGGIRLGATNPSAFKLELYVTNLNKKGASAFEPLGILDYRQNQEIQFVPSARVPTDGLVLRGPYSTITVAVFAATASLSAAPVPPPTVVDLPVKPTVSPMKAEPAPLSPPPPPPPIQQIHQQLQPTIQQLHPFTHHQIKRQSIEDEEPPPPPPPPKPKQEPPLHAGHGHRHHDVHQSSSKSAPELAAPLPHAARSLTRVKEEPRRPSGSHSMQALQIPSPQSFRDPLNVKVESPAAAALGRQSSSSDPQLLATVKLDPNVSPMISPPPPPKPAHQHHHRDGHQGLKTSPESATPTSTPRSWSLVAPPPTPDVMTPTPTKEPTPVKAEPQQIESIQPIQTIGTIGTSFKKPIASDNWEAPPASEAEFHEREMRERCGEMREARENRDMREIRDGRDARDARDLREGRDGRGSRQDMMMHSPPPQSAQQQQPMPQHPYEGQHMQHPPMIPPTLPAMNVPPPTWPPMASVAPPPQTMHMTTAPPVVPLMQTAARPVSPQHQGPPPQLTQQLHPHGPQIPQMQPLPHPPPSLITPLMAADGAFPRHRSPSAPRIRNSRSPGRRTRSRSRSPTSGVLRPRDASPSAASRSSKSHDRHFRVPPRLSPDKDDSKRSLPPPNDKPLEKQGGEDGEIQDAEPDLMGDLEEISDDEDFIEDASTGGGVTMEQLAEEIDWLKAGVARVSSWLPDAEGRFRVEGLKSMRNPSLTDYEWQVESMKRSFRRKMMLRSRDSDNAEEEEEEPRPDEATAILETIARHPSGRETGRSDGSPTSGDEENRNFPVGRNEKWVVTMEGLPALIPIGLAYLISMEGRYDVLTTLIHWTLEGLDLEMAMAQPETPFKVRHLKAGVALATALCHCDNHIASEANKRHLQHRLLSLFVSPNMSTSVKLHIVKALEASIRLKSGMQHFFTLIDRKGQTPYQRLMDIVATTKQLARVTVALSVVFRKAHIYEELSLLMKTTERVASSVSTVEGEDGTFIVQLSSDEQTESNQGNGAIFSSSQEKDLDDIIGFLKNLATAWTEGDRLFAAHRRCLPSSQQFAVLTAESDWTSFLCHIFDTHSLLESIAMLLSSDVATCYAPLNNAISQMLTSLIKRPAGLIFLGSREESSERIINHLTKDDNLDPVQSQAGDDNSERDASVPPEDEASKDEPVEASAPKSNKNPLANVTLSRQGELGVSLHQHLFVMNLLDSIKTAHENCRFVSSLDAGSTQKISAAVKETAVKDSHVILSLLHCLVDFSHSVSPDAVVSVLTRGDNMEILIPFLEALRRAQESGDEDTVDGLSRILPVAGGYAVQLVALAAQECDDAEFIRKYARRVMHVIGKAETKLVVDAPRIDVIRELWSVTLDVTSGFDVASVTDWAKHFKTFSEEISESGIPKAIITCLRVLVDLCIPPEERNEGIPKHGSKGEESLTVARELKYRFSLVEFFHEEGKLNLQNVLIKTCSDFLIRPWQQGALINSADVSSAIVIVQHSVVLLSNILKHLIEAKSTNYKDVTPVQPLFGAFNVLCSIQSHIKLPPARIRLIRHNVLEGLLALTQLMDAPTGSINDKVSVSNKGEDDASEDSLWTMMIKEILDLCQTMPYSFYGGMLLLSELLPFPLPLQTRHPMTTSEVAIHAENRKRWSRHMLPLKNQLVETIKTQALCMPHKHQGIFQKVCCQIADLSHQMAAIILGSFQDMALDCLHLIIGQSVKPTSANFMNTPGGLDPAAACAKVMTAFSVLVSQPSIKCTFLSLLDGSDNEAFKNSTGDASRGRYGAVADPSRAPRFLAILMHVFEESTDNTLTLQLQECIGTIFQSLLDSDINLCGPDLPLQVRLANAIPSPKYLRDIAEALISHIGNNDHSMSSVLGALRGLVLFSEFDYTMFHLKNAFTKAQKNYERENEEGAASDLYNLFARLHSTFAKDDEYLAMLQGAIELLNVMMVVDGREEDSEGSKQLRRYVFGPDYVKQLVKWDGDRETKHPLGDLEKLLHDYAAEEEEEGEETLQSLHETLVNILGRMFGDGAPPSGRHTTTVMTEVDLKEKPRSLETKFSSRNMYVVLRDEDERLNSEFWDEQENYYNPTDDDLVKLDLMDLAKRYANNFDLVGALAKDHPDLPEDFKTPRKKPKRAGRDTINISRGGGKGKKFVAPMRGGRGGCPARSGPPGRQDPFRSRPPNTSRPPSMHVDDFLQMELDKIEKYEREKKEQERINLLNAERPVKEGSPKTNVEVGASGSQEDRTGSPARLIRERDSTRGGSSERARNGSTNPPLRGSSSRGLPFRAGGGDPRGRYPGGGRGSSREPFRAGPRSSPPRSGTFAGSRGDSPPRGNGRGFNDRGGGRGGGGFHTRGGRGTGRGGRDFDSRNHSRSFTR